MVLTTSARTGVPQPFNGISGVSGSEDERIDAPGTGPGLAVTDTGAHLLHEPAPTTPVR